MRGIINENAGDRWSIPGTATIELQGEDPMVINTVNIALQVPCVQGYFGKRLVTYTSQLSPGGIVNVLGHDPRSALWKRLPTDELREIYKYLQRKTSKSRRDSIEGYIEERFGPDALMIGGFPAISIAVQQPTTFRPYDPNDPKKRAIGELELDLSPARPRVLIDGLGRVTGALELMDHGDAGIVEGFAFPVTFYVPAPGTPPLSWVEMGQLFHDFNFRVYPVSQSHALSLDQSDLYVALANKLAETNVIKSNGGMAKRAASLGRKSTELVVQTVFVRTVRGACEGRAFQEANLAATDNPNLTRETFPQMLSSLENYFTTIAQEMGEAFVDKSSLHLASPGWQALGVIFHDIMFKLGGDKSMQNQIARKIAHIDWGRGNPEWQQMNIGGPEIDKMTGQPATDDRGRVKVALTGAGRTSTQKIIDYVRAKTGIDVMLSQKGIVDQGEAEAA
jgi:DGQHR domain-containing protein